MARTVSLLQLRTDISAQCDFVTSTTGRYTPTLLNRLVNESIAEFRERISATGDTHYLVATSGSLTSGATSPYSFKELDLSATDPSIVRIYGVDINVSNIVRTLAHRPFEERNTFGGPTTTGIPCAWASYQTRKIAIMPAPDQAYAYTVWYLPVLADLSADGDTFDGVAGWEQWIVWDVVCNLIARDQYAAAYQMAVAQRDQKWANIQRNAVKVSSAGGAHIGRDTLRASQFSRRGADFPVGGPSALPPDGSVTLAMMASMPEARTIGRPRNAGAGSPTYMTPGDMAGNVSVYSGFAAGLVPTGDGTTTTFLRKDGAWAAPSVGGSVSGLALSQLQDFPSPAVLGRIGLGTGAPTFLGPSQVATLMPYFSSGMKGVVAGPSGADGTTFLRDDNTWQTPPGAASSGTGISPSLLTMFPPSTVLGNYSSPTAIGTYLNGLSIASMLPGFGPLTKGVVKSPTGGLQNKFLRDDNSWQGIPSNIPTGIDFAQLLPMPEAILGRLGPSGVPTFLSGSAVATMLPVFNNVDKGLVPQASAGDTTKFLRADQTWAVPPSSGGGGANNPGLPTMSVQFNLGSGIFGGSTGMLFDPSGLGQLQLSHNFRVPTGTILLGATGTDSEHVGWLGAYSGAVNIGLGTGSANPAISIENPPDAIGNIRLRTWDVDGSGSPREWARIGRSAGSGALNLTLGLESNSSLFRGKTLQFIANGPTGVIRGILGANLQEAFAARPGHHAWGVSGAQRLGLDERGLNLWGQLGVQPNAHSASADKLGTWTASGFASVASGIQIGASGMQLSVGTGGPQLTASGIDMRQGDIINALRINGLDGVKLFGNLAGGASSGTVEICVASGTAFVVPASTTVGQVNALVPSLAVHGDTIILENRSATPQWIYNNGSGSTTPSAFIATLMPSGGMSFRNASGGWVVQSRYQLGGF